MRITGDSPAAGSGEGSTSRQGPAATLDDAMRAPSTNPPEVVVLDTMPDGLGRKEYLDPKEDLWLSTADARYSSPIIPLRVGEPPHQETFFVHKNILLKYEYFDKALCGEFRESQAQSIDLPEENPATFHFLVAFLYEGRYVPIKPMSAALDPELDKGKGKEVGTETPDSDSDSSGSATSGNSVVSLRRLDRQRRRHDRHFERMRQKHPGHHRPNCHCPQCLAAGGPPCWHCAAPRVAPHPPGIPPPPPPGIAVVDRDRSRRHQRRRHPPLAPPLAPPPPPDPNGGGRIRGEDMRTWLLTYELNLDVYILANKFLLDGFKREVARACIDMLETAGSDAARPEVLRLCTKLYHGLSETDPLLKMIFARIGFLQPALWRTAAQETSDFLVTNPEIAALLLRETGNRREEDSSGRSLPSMEMPWVPPPDSPYRAPPPYHIARPRRQW